MEDKKQQTRWYNALASIIIKVLMLAIESGIWVNKGGSMEVSAESTAKLLAKWAEEDGVEDLSPLKMQKLLYLIEGGLLADESVTSFFPETPVAWQYGPVYTNVYEMFRTKQNREPIIEADFDNNLSTDFDSDVLSSMRTTWDRYKNKPASELVTITHRTQPWIIAKDYGYGSRISKEDMTEFFTQSRHDTEE